MIGSQSVKVFAGATASATCPAGKAVMPWEVALIVLHQPYYVTEIHRVNCPPQSAVAAVSNGTVLTSIDV
jgi:hypothetical protein